MPENSESCLVGAGPGGESWHFAPKDPDLGARDTGPSGAKAPAVSAVLSRVRRRRLLFIAVGCCCSFCLSTTQLSGVQRVLRSWPGRGRWPGGLEESPKQGSYGVLLKRDATAHSAEHREPQLRKTPSNRHVPRRLPETRSESQANNSFKICYCGRRALRRKPCFLYRSLIKKVLLSTSITAED